MRLEQEIRQTKGFGSQKRKAVVNIMFTHGWLQGQMRDWLKPFGITAQQYNVMRILRGSNPKPLSTSDIRDRMLDKMSDASRIVDRLNAKGLLKRTICPTDRRLVDIVITEKGLELLTKMDQSESIVDQIMGSLTEQQAEQLNELLDLARNSQR